MFDPLTTHTFLLLRWLKKRQIYSLLFIIFCESQIVHFVSNWWVKDTHKVILFDLLSNVLLIQVNVYIRNKRPQHNSSLEFTSAHSLSASSYLEDLLEPIPAVICQRTRWTAPQKSPGTWKAPKPSYCEAKKQTPTPPCSLWCIQMYQSREEHSGNPSVCPPTPFICPFVIHAAALCTCRSVRQLSPLIEAWQAATELLLMMWMSLWIAAPWHPARKRNRC